MIDMMMIRVALILFTSILLLSCSNKQVNFTSAGGLSQPAPPTEFTDANGNKMTSPGGWPDCWLSSRLSAVQAAIVGGETPQNGWRGKFLYPQNKRHEYEGETQNPHAKGKCTLNWFDNDADNANEPWINNRSNDSTKQGMQQKYPSGYTAALTCTAEATPKCHCITVIPTNPGPDTNFGIGLCVRKVPGTLAERPKAGDDFELFNYRLPDTSLPLEPAGGRCDGARNDLRALYSSQWEDILAQQSDDTISINGNSCRLDIEPFSAPPEEATWYGDKIRDWAVVTCKSDACRCFGTFSKSGLVKDKRSSWFEDETCVICGEKDGKPACSSANLQK